MKKSYLIIWVLLIGLTGIITLIATRKLPDTPRQASKSTENKPKPEASAEFSQRVADLQKDWTNLNLMLNSLTVQVPAKTAPPQQTETPPRSDDPFAELKKRRAELDNQQGNQSNNTPPVNPPTESEQREKQQKFRQWLIETTAKRLNLADYQQVEFIKIFAERNQKLSETIGRFRGGQMTYDQVSPEVDKIRAETDEKLKATLSAQQYEEYKRMEGNKMMGGRILKGDE
ncbi:MAG: hypothetical protein HY762_09480 [Planctomycetes bacterium]|nr:hypothetical protein [Planctomycetota bacterium]